MQRQQLSVSAREGTGKGVARKLRVNGQVPAVLYGRGVDPVPLVVGSLELDRVAHVGANALVDLRGAVGAEGKLVLIKELQRDPVRRTPLHCDFYVIDPKRKIEVTVPLEFTGKPHGVEMGGVLETVVRELEVEVLPMAIPDRIEMDVSALDIGDAIHVRDLDLPVGVEVLGEPDRTLVHVITPRVVEVEAEAAEGEEAAAGEAPDGDQAAAEASAEGDGDDS